MDGCTACEEAWCGIAVRTLRGTGKATVEVTNVGAEVEPWP